MHQKHDDDAAARHRGGDELTPAWLTTPPKLLGRRGAILALLGSTWVIQGAGVAIGSWSPIPPPVIYDGLPIWAQSGMWLVAGVVALAAARSRHPRDDSFGFKAAILPVAAMVAMWVVSIVWMLLAGWPVTSMLGAVMAAWIWSAVAMLILTVAGWVETPVNVITPGGDVDPTPRHGGDA